jgi:hypothetical protein
MPITDGQDMLQPAIGSLAHTGESHSEPPRGFTIADGQGGVLSLDLASPNLDAFAEACRILAKGPLRSGATMLIVRLEPDAYVLNYSAGAQGAGEVHIAKLRDPLARICLSPELVEVVATLIEESARRHRVS